MSHGINSESVRTSVRISDFVDALVTAWLRWERNPSSAHAVADKEVALAALGLAGCEAHEYVAAARRAGFDVPSAVARAANDVGSRCAG